MGILFPETNTKKSTASGAYVKGVWTPGSETLSNIIIDVQPVTGNELESLEIGRRDLGKVKAYSNISLNVADEKNKINGDIIVYDNRNWEIISRLPYQHGLINHYKYFAEYRGSAS